MSRRPRPLAGTSRDRAQVLLVGAVVLAFLILALVPVFNGVFAPDSAGNDEPPEVGDGPVSLRQDHQTTARELAVRIGHRDTYASGSPILDRLEGALANYTRVTAESAVEGRGWFVETTVNASAPGTLTGTRVVQREAAPLVMPNMGAGGAPTWWVVGPSTGSELGWFVTRLDTTNLSRSEPLVLTVANASDEMVVRVNRQAYSDDVELTVNGTLVTTDEPVTCDAPGGQVVLDLYRGYSGTRDCTFPGLDSLAGPVTVRVDEGDEARGVYELVVADVGTLNPQIPACDGSAPTTEPCHSTVLWQVSLSTTVDGGRTNYTTTTNVSVYGGGR